jgi:ribonuclease HII
LAEIKSEYKFIIGVDEVGLGSLAGPAVMSAVVLREGQAIKGVMDSKKIEEFKRYEIFDRIMNECEYYVSIFSSSKSIDKYGLAKVHKVLMFMCAEASRIYFPDSKVIMDGNKKIPILENTESIIKADQKIQAVSAASIISKVLRDSYMIKVSSKWPMYEFNRNKGYGTQNHLAAIRRYGPCEEHRTSFDPIRKGLKNARGTTK